IAERPASFADRMIPVEGRRLSSTYGFPAYPDMPTENPMQRFFHWNSEIGPSTISSRLVLVASRQRALEFLDGVQSNGVRLLDHGLVRFVGAIPSATEVHGTLILVAPSLSAAR